MRMIIAFISITFNLLLFHYFKWSRFTSNDTAHQMVLPIFFVRSINCSTHLSLWHFFSHLLCSIANSQYGKKRAVKRLREKGGKRNSTKWNWQHEKPSQSEIEHLNAIKFKHSMRMSMTIIRSSREQCIHIYIFSIWY